jgi:iron complex outermembrane receptor protein
MALATTAGIRRKALLASTAAFCALAAGQAFAQQTANPLPTAAGTPATPPTADSAQELEAVVVTGTAIRGVAPVGSATVNIDRTTLVQNGIHDPGSLITQLPQGSGLGSTLQNNAGRNAGVNLRGLGNNATLLLFDGHRTVQQGVTSQISDPNTIPFAAIERVEVVTDGASAIYGSDAVAGVVNYILRKRFEGAELSARYTNSLYDQYTAEGLIGHSWGSGSVMLGLSYENNNHVRRDRSKFLAQDLRPFGGNDNRFIGTSVQPGLTPALIVGTTVYGLPGGLNGRTPTAAEVQALRNNPDLLDSSTLSDYYTARRRESGIFRVNQDFGRAGELTFTTLFNIRENRAPGTGDGAFANIAVRVNPGGPYYIPGLGSGSQSVVYNFRANNPGRALDQKNYEGTVNGTLDYRVKLFGDFQFTGTGTYGYNYGCAVCQPQANTVLAAVITQPGTAALFNPYLNGPQPTAEGLFGGFTQEATNKLIDVVGKVDGTLFTLPGGDMRIAVGAEYQKLDFWLKAQNTLNLTTTYQTSRYAKSHRIIKSGFGELFIPIFGTANSRPGLRRLDLSAALRYDEYSDVGNTTNPKFGVSWKPVEDLLLRGSWGTSFRAATLGESDPRTVGQTNRQFISNGLNNPAIPVTNAATGQSLVLNRGGNTAGLKPESAKVWSLGADYNPSFVPGLRLGVTYYNVNYKDRIENLPNATLILSNPETYDLYKDFFIVAPQPATCVNGAQPGLPGTPEYATYNPAYLSWLNNPNAVYSPTTANDCQLVGIITGGRLNLGRVKQSGLDFTANYAFETGIGRVNVGGVFTKILDLKRSLLPTSPLFDALDTIGNQVSSRGRFNLGLEHGPIRANLFMNYVGSYLNNATITVNGTKLPDTKVPSWTTFDAGLSYTTPDGPGALSGIRVAVNVQNLTDKDPPIVLSGAGNNATAVDLDVHNIWGRVWSFEVTKRF